MLASDFAAKLRRLNKNLRIYCGDNDSRLAGLYHVVNGEYKDIIGVDKNYLTEWPVQDEQGRILKGGWRRVVRLLIEQGLVDRRQAERVFGTQIIGTRRPPTVSAYVDPIEKQIQEAYTRGYLKTGKPAMNKDDIMDIAKEIENKNADQLNNQ